jgi:hypothetical protein
MSDSGGINFTHIFSALGALVPFLTALAIVAGLFFFITGLYRFALAAQNPRYTVAQGVARLMGGIFLMSITTSVNLFTASALGHNASLDFLAYTPPGGTEAGGEVIRLAIVGVRILGYIMVIRALWLLAQAWDNSHELGTVFTHLIGGVVCINIIWFLHAVGYTVGGALSSTITRLFG